MTRLRAVALPLPWRGDRVLRALRAMPGFAAGALRSFRANQGLLLAGAVAYYTLLSLVPLLVLVLIGLARVTDQTQLLATVSEYLEFLVPGQSEPVMEQLRIVLAHREVVGGILLASMLFFSALAFTGRRCCPTYSSCSSASACSQRRSCREGSRCWQPARSRSSAPPIRWNRCRIICCM
jgi:hypothetical protein